MIRSFDVRDSEDGGRIAEITRDDGSTLTLVWHPRTAEKLVWHDDRDGANGAIHDLALPTRLMK